MPALEGGAPIPVTTGGAGQLDGRRAAVPVYVVSGAGPVVGQKARRVVVVTSGPVEGGAARPVYDAGVSAVYSAEPALPVFVVSGSLAGGANPLAYTNKVIALNPIAYWPLAEASGTVMTDESGNGRNGAYRASGEPLLGQTGIGDGRTAALFDGTNDYANAFSASTQAAFNGPEGTIALWFKAGGAGVWTDATDRRLAQFRVDANNRAYLQRSTTNNVITANYIAGGTAKAVNFTTAAPTTWQHFAMTWSKTADQMIAYVNGVQVGAIQTGLGTWAGSLATTLTVLGASDTSGSNPWSGSEAHTAVWALALSAAQVAILAVVP